MGFRSIRAISGIQDPAVSTVLREIKENIEAIISSGITTEDLAKIHASVTITETLPYMGHFHSTTVADADITITGCPFRPRYAFFLSEGDHGFAVGWDNLTSAICMGVYSGLATVEGLGATGGGDASWECMDTALIQSYGRITSFTSDGFITHQHIGATSGLALRVQYILFP